MPRSGKKAGRRRPLVVALLALAALPAPALADRDAEVAIQDDQLILTHKQERVDGAMTVFKNLGVDRVRVSVFWKDIAPSPRSTRRPKRFDPTNGRSRRYYDWRNLDRVVRSASEQGLKLLLTITTPEPLWGSLSPRKKNGVWKPDPADFADFAEAVAKRYGSRVDMYSIMNEPNQGAWLQPQSERGRYFAPHLYRDIVNAAYPRIKAADPTSTVLVGELAPIGRKDKGVTRPIRPLKFLREFACVDDNYQPITTGRCANFVPPPADMIATHPYQVKGDPAIASSSSDDAAIGDWSRLFGALDTLTAGGRILSQQKPQLDVYYTEFGYQTKPPDPYSGISLKRQDTYLQRASYIAWATPRVRGNTQFRLTDGQLIKTRNKRLRYAEIQSGLLFARGRPKPSYYNFFDPFWIEPQVAPPGTNIQLWGQVRPGDAHEVIIEQRPDRSQPWTEVIRVNTDPLGYFELFLPAAAGEWRYRWDDGVSATRVVRVG